jgi:hypothetical protein
VPTTIYRVKSGERVSGVTTIIGANLGWNKEQLKIWAHRMGLDGKDIRQVTQDACDAGTLAHAMAEADIKGLEIPKPGLSTSADVAAKAEAAFGAYLSWKRMTKVELILSEVSLISEQWGYGGTLDAVGSVDSELNVVDFKTSNSTYPDHLIQIAAYKELWNEIHPDTPIKGCHLLRFGKQDGDFHHHSYPSLDRYWEAFKHLLALHKLKKQIGKAA